MGVNAVTIDAYEPDAYEPHSRGGYLSAVFRVTSSDPVTKGAVMACEEDNENMGIPKIRQILPPSVPCRQLKTRSLFTNLQCKCPICWPLLSYFDAGGAWHFAIFSDQPWKSFRQWLAQAGPALPSLL